MILARVSWDLKDIYVSYLKLEFYCFTHEQCQIRIYFIQLVSQHQTVAIDFKSSNKNAAGGQKRNEHRNYWILIKASWVFIDFALDLLDVDLLAIYLSDAD